MIFNRCVCGFMPNLTKNLGRFLVWVFPLRILDQPCGPSMTEQLGTSGNLQEPTAAGSRIFYVICTAAFLEVPGRSIIDGPNGSHHASIVHAINSASSNLKSGVTLLL